MNTTTYLIDTPNLVKPLVPLVGEDGNAFSIIGRITKAWKRLGRPDIAKEFQERATSGDYNNLLTVAMQYVDEEAAWGEDEEEDEDDEYEGSYQEMLDDEYDAYQEMIAEQEEEEE